MLKLTINPEYESLLPKLPKEECEALKQSIKSEGQHFLITANMDGVILDGHHRYKICSELGIEPKYEVKKFKNKLLEKKFVIESNLKRRHLNKFQKAELLFPLLKIERQLAKERMVQAHVNPHQLMGAKKGEATEFVVKHGLSKPTFERALRVIEYGSEELKDRVRKGKTSIYYAFKMVKRKQESGQYPEMPNDKYNVVYADPPWRYDLAFAGSPDMHYTTLTTEEICRIDVPSSENAVLFLWSTNAFLKDALRVMESWGFTYKTNRVWVKNIGGIGYWFRGRHELLLLGTKGEMHPPMEKDRFDSVLYALRQLHSEKPNEVYEMIEQMFPNAKYLELFARQRRYGWESWGTEIKPQIESQS